MKPTVLLFLLWVIYGNGYSQESKSGNDLQIEFAKDHFEYVVRKDFARLDSLYLSKDEMIEMYGALNPGPTAFELSKELEKYDRNKNIFGINYRSSTSRLILAMTACDSIHWDKVTLDSIAYAYIVLNPSGKDSEIPWPESKSYSLKDSELIVCKSFVYFNDGKKRYLCVLFSHYFKSTWRFYKTTRVPRFTVIK